MAVPDELQAALQAGCERLGLPLSGAQAAKLSRYLRMLEQWNRVYNLTAVRALPEMLTHHAFDALAVSPYLQGDRLLDVGTGPGLPGIPLALVNPDRSFLLLDSNGKKTRFLVQFLSEVSVPNVCVVQQRAEHLVDNQGFDMILSRAFASLAEMLACTGHLLAPQGQWLAMKGTYPTAELAALPDGLVETVIHRVAVPGLDAERHIVMLRRQRITH